VDGSVNRPAIDLRCAKSIRALSILRGSGKVVRTSPLDSPDDLD
jgi:hypothetical protein